MRDVIAQDFFLDPPQRRAHRRNLRDDVDAVALFLDHLRYAADLALDPAQAPLQRYLAVFPHAAYIPPQGICFKTGASDERSRTGACARDKNLLRRATFGPEPRMAFGLVAA